MVGGWGINVEMGWGGKEVWDVEQLEAARFTSAIHTITSNPAANVVTMINTFFKNFILVTYDRRSPA